jgi:hypothetical protein
MGGRLDSFESLVEGRDLWLSFRRRQIGCDRLSCGARRGLEEENPCSGRVHQGWEGIAGCNRGGKDKGRLESYAVRPFTSYIYFLSQFHS